MIEIRYAICLFSIVLLFISGCAPNSAKDQELDYEKTKDMVVDILKTDEGKRVLRDMMLDDKMKENLVLESDEVQSAVSNMFTSEDGKKIWKELFEDPEFAKTYIDSTKGEQEKLFKELMNDPEFQKQFIQLLKDPALNDQKITLLKSQEFRKHLQDVITETLESPLFQSKIKDTLLKAAKEKEKSEEGSKKDSGS